MKLHVTLKYDSFERSFFVSCDQENRTFKWLAKVVFHRYTIFVPTVDKVPPPHMQLHAAPSKELMICSRTFSPPIEANISDFMKDGDMVICRLENNPQSEDVRIKFYIKYSGKTTGRTYVILTAKKQEELCSEFKTNRFHQFQRENQKKLSQFIQTQTQTQQTPLHAVSTPAPPAPAPPPAGPATATGAPSPIRRPVRGKTQPTAGGRVLQAPPRPPHMGHNSHMSHKFRRRVVEKATLKANNQPLYDYDPDEDFEEEEDHYFPVDMSPGLCDGNNDDDDDDDDNDNDNFDEENDNEHTDKDTNATAADSQRVRGQSIAMTSRQVSLLLRRKSSRRTSSMGLHSPRRTDIRQTLLELFRTGANKPGAGNSNHRNSTLGASPLSDKNKHNGRDKTRHVLKPNGPISKDVVWRQRALASGGLRYDEDKTYPTTKWRSGSKNIAKTAIL